MNELLPILFSGIVCGLVTWGGVRAELKYLRRDVDDAHRKIDDHIKALRACKA